MSQPVVSAPSPTASKAQGNDVVPSYQEVSSGGKEAPEHYEAAIPDDATGGVGDEGPSTTPGEESGVNEMPEQPEAVALDEVAEALVLELSDIETQSLPEESGDLGFEFTPSEAAIAMAIVPSTSVPAAKSSFGFSSIKESGMCMTLRELHTWAGPLAR
ncbi:hypothetical protein AMTR_s00241p00019710 [Amborella trichopoda]|uniref:Uncharacterized protein n=1 Tax=Amborella trichopoda TaxID=13333 RepID=W1NRD1_AMBTC|nr:hypothetical protein AMTR_s00241p00019710 [Amborella trichopoda]